MLRASLSLRQVLPASSERNMPPSSASISAHTRFGLAGETATPMRPHTLFFGRASCVSLLQLSPPSTVFQRLLPGPPLSMLQGVRFASQNEAYSTRGLVASIARSTAPVLSST